MMLLREAQRLASAYMDDIIGLDDYGIDVQYKGGCKRLFAVTANDWTGREFSAFLHEKSLADGCCLAWTIHDLIEALNVYAS